MSNASDLFLDLSSGSQPVRVRTALPSDHDAIVEVSHRVYPPSLAWTYRELESHQSIFPEGQIVAVDANTGRLLGAAMSLIVTWDDYEITDDYEDFTDKGMFTNHDPAGRTLYGAEVFVHPDARGQGIGRLLYSARRVLCSKLGLLRIRAGARLPGYESWSDRLNVYDYVMEVIRGRIYDPTLSFQLRNDFNVIQIVSGYLAPDAQSANYAALIEWINTEMALDQDIKRARENYARFLAG
ncbi:MAG: GNAT family N-acetyltransferase [Spirochaetota bacterium]